MEKGLSGQCLPDTYAVREEEIEDLFPPQSSSQKAFVRGGGDLMKLLLRVVHCREHLCLVTGQCDYGDAVSHGVHMLVLLGRSSEQPCGTAAMLFLQRCSCGNTIAKLIFPLSILEHPFMSTHMSGLS